MQWYLLQYRGEDLVCSIHERYTDADVDSFHERAKQKLAQFDADDLRYGKGTLLEEHRRDTRATMNEWLALRKGQAVLVFTSVIKDGKLIWRKNLIVNQDDMTEIETPKLVLDKPID